MSHKKYCRRIFLNLSFIFNCSIVERKVSSWERASVFVAVGEAVDE